MDGIRERDRKIAEGMVGQKVEKVKSFQKCETSKERDPNKRERQWC